MAGISPAEWLRLITEHAKALREAGVTRLKLSGCELELSKEEPMVVRIESEERTFEDPLDDPATFGGRMPGFRRRRDEGEA